MKFLSKLSKKAKRLVATCAVATMSMSMMAVTCGAEEVTPTFSVSESISGVAPAIIKGFGEVITGCIDLAVALVPISLAFLGVTLLIKKGKQLMKSGT